MQILETDEPGRMRVWAMVAGNLHSMHVMVPRRFYLNLREPDPTQARKVTKALPRSAPCLNLYEISMSERHVSAFMVIQSLLVSFLT